MSARRPEDLDRLFAQGLNAGDLEASAALYEPGAALVAQPGQTVSGSAAIRDALRGFLGMKPTLTIMDVKTLAQAGDTALTTAKWRLTGTGPDGNPVNMSGQSVEVCRRQADGTWRFIIDTPWGLEWDA
jgi:uncharacterized protein (TIGR02246 family)